MLPIALPGIVTGVALQNAFTKVLPDIGIDIGLGLITVIIAHTTFCLVIVFNNVVARLRRASSLDGGGVDGPRGRRPSRRSAS